MNLVPERRKEIGRCLIGLCFVLSLLFLPLHFHEQTGASVTHECICHHGSRTVVGMASTAVFQAPPVSFILVQAYHPRLDSQSTDGRQSIRAPPGVAQIVSL